MKTFSRFILNGNYEKMIIVFLIIDDATEYCLHITV
jgi:hypothetical protein